jgi:hypothetical protein
MAIGTVLELFGFAQFATRPDLANLFARGTVTFTDRPRAMQSHFFSPAASTAVRHFPSSLA